METCTGRTGSPPNAAAVDLEKLISLFEGPNSADLYERHVAAVQKLCRSNASGFAIRDLPKVQQVLELSLALLKRGQDCFLEAVCELVSALSKPFIRRTATDEFKMLNHITTLLAAVGDIFRSSGIPPQLQAVAAQTVTVFATAYGNRPNALDLQSTQHGDADGAQRQYHTNQSLVHKSGVVADVIVALARALLAGPEDPLAPLVVPLLNALLAFSYHPDNCAAMAESGALQCLPPLLARGQHAPTTPTAVELLWNMVEQAPSTRELLSKPLPQLHTLARGPGHAAGGVLQSASQLGYMNGGRLSPDGGMTSSPYGSRPHTAGNGADAESADATLDAGSLRGSEPGYAASRDGLSSRGSVAASSGTAAGEDSALGLGQVPDGLRSRGSVIAGTPSGASVSLGLDGHGDGDAFSDTPDLRMGGGGAGGGSGTGALGPIAEEEPSSMSLNGLHDVGSPVVQALSDALTALLRALLLGGFSHADKELRNDVMVVLNLLLEAHDFRVAAAFSGLYDTLIAAATCPEVGTRPELVAPHALSTDVLDQELRLLVWGALEKGCLLPEVLDQAVAAGFVRVLLLYVSPGESHSGVRRWNRDQLAALRSAALSKLHTVSPLCPEEYERAGGAATLLAFVSSSNPGAAHMEGALRHMHRLFQMVPETRDAFGGAGLIPVLLGVVNDSVGSGTGGGALGNTGAASAGQPEPVRHFALLCLTVLCTVHAENQRRLRKAQGVGVLLAALSKLRGLDPLLPSPYAVAVLDCLGAAVVPDRKSAAHFLVERGLDHLLNHLEVGNKAHRPVLLRVLSDLLENQRSHPFFHDWQSDTNKQTAAHLLLAIWMEEDALRGMSGPDGLLANTARPLAGLDKRTRWLPAENVAYGNMSAAKKETLTLMMETVSSEAVLARIYGVFKLLGFDRCDYLAPRDQAVLAVVEKYAKFRQGDMWRTIQAEFDASGMRPTAPDRARLASGIELAESLAEAVREAQGRLLGRAQEGARQHEAKLFEGMRQQAKLEAEYRTIALQEKSPLTLAEMRRAKEQKATMLKNSMQSFQFQHGNDDD